MTRARELFHVALPGDWEAAQQDGRYTMSTRSRTLAEEGFIHCSYADQLDGTLERFYADLPEVVVLTLDPELLDAEVKIEGGFPHVYGPLPIAAVVDVSRRSPG